MDEMLYEIRRMLGIGFEVWGGRSAEINGRVARLMGQEIKDEAPCEEYARLAKLAVPRGKGERQTAD